jgi:hypothetical protein
MTAPIRHLLPDEIDQLLDGEVGFGVAPLEAHVRECDQCRAELEAGRRLVDAVERLPRLAPSPLFAEHAMAQVNVYEPWYVAARDFAERSVARLAPQSRPLRVVAGAAGLSVAAAVTVACVWLAGHLGAVFFFGTVLRARLRDAVIEQLGAVVSGLFGPQAVDTLRAGGPAFVIAAMTAVVVLIMAAGLAVRSVVARSRRTRG